MNALIGTTAGAYDSEGTPLIESTRINHLARQGDDWWAVDGKGQLRRNTEVVARIPAGLAANCVQPTHSTILVGTTEAKLFELEKGQLVEDEFFADAPTRDKWYTPWGGPPDVRSMDVDTDGAVYVNVHVGGIIRYDNTGVVPTIDLDQDVHQVVTSHVIQGSVVAATAYGLAESHNGHDFETRSTGLFATYCRAVALKGEAVFVSASNGPRATEGRAYRTTIHGDGFDLLTGGLPDFHGNIDTHCLGVVDGRVYLGHGGSGWASEDDGDTWVEMVGGLPHITCVA